MIEIFLKKLKLDGKWFGFAVALGFVYLIEDLKGNLESNDSIYLVMLVIFTLAVSNILGSLNKEDKKIEIEFIDKDNSKVANWTISESKLSYYLPKVNDELRLSKNEVYQVQKFVYGSLSSEEWNKIICEVKLLENNKKDTE